MEQVKIEGAKFKNELFTVASLVDMTDYPNIVRQMKESGFEPQYYMLERVVTGRKKPYQIECLKYKKSGRFITAA